MNNNDREFYIQKIRDRYTEKVESPLSELSALDKRVSLPVNIFSYAFGSVGALILGGGMSFIMTDLAASLGVSAPLAVGLPLGIIGLFMTLINYPIYKLWLAKRRKKYADEVLALSDKLSRK